MSLNIFKCEVCGNIVESIIENTRNLNCCNKPMTRLEGRKHDAGSEKHVPVVEIENGIVKVKVGEILHPMEDGHFIQWIELIGNKGEYLRVMFEPNDKPVKTIKCDFSVKQVRAYCNIHGLWIKDVE